MTINAGRERKEKKPRERGEKEGEERGSCSFSSSPEGCIMHLASSRAHPALLFAMVLVLFSRFFYISDRFGDQGFEVIIDDSRDCVLHEGRGVLLEKLLVGVLPQRGGGRGARGNGQSLRPARRNELQTQRN